jgi:hypothetical protein
VVPVPLEETVPGVWPAGFPSASILPHGVRGNGDVLS